jgi:hypothetical protein
VSDAWRAGADCLAGGARANFLRPGSGGGRAEPSVLVARFLSPNAVAANVSRAEQCQSRSGSLREAGHLNQNATDLCQLTAERFLGESAS